MSKADTKNPAHLNKSFGRIGRMGSIVTSKLFAAIMAFTMASLIGWEAGAATLCLIGLNTDDGGDGGTLLGGDGDGDGGGGDGDGGDGSGDGDGDGGTPWTADMSDEMKEFFGESKSLKEFQENMPKAADVPEEYVLPEGAEIDQDQFAVFLPFAKEGNFTQAQMDVLLKYEGERSAAFPEQMYAATQAVMAEGLAEMKTSLGDEGYNETVTGAKLYRDNLPPELKQEALEFFDKTGMGNHPTLIKILAAHSKRFKEDAFTGGGGDGGKSELTPAQRMYPNQGKDK